MKRLIALLFVSLAAGAAHAAPEAQPRLTQVEPREQALPTVEGLRKSGSQRATRARAVALERPGEEVSRELGAPQRGIALKIGVARAVKALGDEEATGAALEWEVLPGGGRAAALSVTSPDAAAVRAALRVAKLPETAAVRFKGPGEATHFEASGADILRALRDNAAAKEAGEDALTYWSPVIDGDTVLVEIELPAGTDVRDVRVALPRVSHLVTSAATTFATPTTLGRSATCNVDASCSAGWSNQMNAVAQMVFSDSSGSYLCTGTLLADSDAASNLPYFLTARHCISTQSMASSLVTYWFYRSNACNSASPGPYQQLAGGATLLYNSTNTDTAFLRLANTPPQGTYYAGWQVSSAASLNTAVTALHQPRGDLLKISQGRVGGYLTCSAPTNGSFSCSSASSGASSFYAVSWSSGITEPGSSGSGLFLGNGMLVGQLYGGGSSCTSGEGDVYGRFDVAYNAGIRNWLSPATSTLTVSRAGTGSGGVSSAPAGISCGSTCSASFPSTASVTLTAAPAAGSLFAGWSGACAGTGACTVAMSAARNVTATFNAVPATLTVSSSGGGTVTSAPAGINCGSTCSAGFATGSSVTLTATAATGMVFRGWSGACSGAGMCTITMNGAQNVSASFGSPTTDLAISQTSSTSAARTGRDVVFTITVVNNGQAATNVIVTDTLPANASFVWASSGCAPSGSTVQCALGSLAAGAGARVMVVVRPSSTGTMTNAASVSATQSDTVAGNNSSTSAVTVTASPAPAWVQRYRLYSPVTQEHHFTTDANEYHTLGSFTGTWIQEGPSGKVLDNPGSYGGVTAVPYYRLYDSSTRWHLWTTEPNEYYTLSQFPWWSAEGIDGFILPARAGDTVPLYRLLYPHIPGLHHWTIDATEYNELVSRFGWVGEGGSGYVMP